MMIDIMTVFFALLFTESLKRIVLYENTKNMKAYFISWFMIIGAICIGMALVIHFTDIKVGLSVSIANCISHHNYRTYWHVVSPKSPMMISLLRAWSVYGPYWLLYGSPTTSACSAPTHPIQSCAIMWKRPSGSAGSSPTSSCYTCSWEWYLREPFSSLRVITMMQIRRLILSSLER